MRKHVATAYLALLLLSGCESAFREEAVWEGGSTSYWVEMTKDEDLEKRRNAVKVLGELGPTEADQTVPALIETLKDDDDAVRYYSLTSLGKIGPVKARPAQSAVGKAIQDRHKQIRKEALKLYREIELAKPSPINGHY
jgi:HEAT repeat protein